MLSQETEVHIYSKSELDLDYDAEPPKQGALIDHHYDKWGRVLVEICDDVLYVNGRNVVDTRCIGRWLDADGYILPQYTGSTVPNARLLDFLLKNREFIPKSWLQREQMILFFGTIFRSLSRDRWKCDKFWVRCLSIGHNQRISGKYINIRCRPDPFYRVAVFKRREDCKFE